jgi:hypothetical protein
MFSPETPTPAMTTSWATGETSSFLVYRAEACLSPVGVKTGRIRTDTRSSHILP